MTTRVLMTSAVAVLLATLTACGGGDGDAAAEPSAAASATDDTPSATTEQYASKVARNRDDLLGAMDDLSSCLVGYGLGEDLEPACAANGLTVEYGAGTLATNLRSLFNRDAPAYIGQPPAEIEGLVSQTIVAATEVESLGTTMSDEECLSGGDSSSCKDTSGKWFRSIGELENQLREWDPYL